MKRITKHAILTLCLLLLISCSNDQSRNIELEGSLRIATINASGFMSSYGDTLQQQFPKIEMNVIEIPIPALSDSALYETFLNEEKPDLISIYNYRVFQELVNQNILLDLTPMFDKNFPEDQFHPRILQTWKGTTQDQIYAMSPQFDLYGLFINDSLFKEKSVPLPEGDLNWKQLFQYASQFQDSSIVGIDNLYQDPFRWLVNMGNIEESYLIDVEGTQLLLDHPIWKSIITVLAEAYHDGVMPLVQQNEQPAADLFLDGSLGIKLEAITYAQRLQASDIEWHFQPLPSVDNNEQYQIHFQTLFAITYQSSKAALSTALLTYMHSDEWVRMHMDPWYLSTLADQIGNFKPYPLNHVFSKIKVLNDLNRFSTGFRSSFSSLFVETMQQVKAGEISIDQAIDELQVKGQVILDQDIMKF